MMKFAPFIVRFKNYRSFVVPAELRVQPGYIALVGPNNGGKSNVLRLMYELRYLFEALARPENAAPSLYSVFGGGAGGDSFNSALNNVRDPESIFPSENMDPLTFEVVSSTPPRPDIPHGPPRQLATPTAIVIRLNRAGEARFGMRHGIDEVAANEFIRATESTVISSRSPHIIFDLASYREAFEVLHDTLYIGSFRNVINQGANENYFDLVVGNALVERWRSYQGGHSKKEALAAASVSREVQRAFGFEDLQLIATADGTNIRAFIGGTTYMLSELGSGVSQFFMTILNLELRHKSVVLIDEPELGLHPQLQTEFLEAIARRTGAVVFTTHSLGLARTMGDVIYTVARNGPGATSTLREFNELNSPLEFLGELNFAGSHDLGYHKILLVEGPTEIKLFRSLLQRLGASHRVTVLPLGGSSSINRKAAHALIELRRLSDKIYAIIDSERTGPQQRAIRERHQFKRNCDRIGIQCHLLENRSIESYFSNAAIKNVLGHQHEALGPHAKVPSNWPKQENWRIAEAMQLSEFTSPDLIDFLKRVAAD